MERTAGRRLDDGQCRKETIQVRAQAGRGELVTIGQPILDGIRMAAKQVTRGLGASLVWPGLLRKLDRLYPGYAD